MGLDMLEILSHDLAYCLIEHFNFKKQIVLVYFFFKLVNLFYRLMNSRDSPDY